MNTKARLDKLAAAIRPQPAEDPADLEEILSKLEAEAGQPAGSLPRTTEAAAAAGFDSLAACYAAALGMTVTELKEELTNGQQYR